MWEVRVSIKVSAKGFTQNRTLWNSLAAASLSSADQTACKCPVDRLDFQIIGRMKARFLPPWASVALSPSCLRLFHAHSIVFTSRCFYSEPVSVFLSFWATSPKDSIAFASVPAKCRLRFAPTPGILAYCHNTGPHEFIVTVAVCLSIPSWPS